MPALILLSNYDNMKKNKNSVPYKESDIPVDMKTLRAFRAEMLSRMSSTDAKIDHIATEMKSLTAKVDSGIAEMKALTARVDGGIAEMKALTARVDSGIAEMKAMNAKVDSGIAEMKSLFHRSFMIFEEQNLRNKQAYDSAAVSYEAVQDLKRRIKSECIES